MSKLTRRTLVTTVASLPALAVPALASAEADPILAAIEAHRRARVEFEACFEREDNPDGAAEEAKHLASSKCDDLAVDLATIEPSTIAGVIGLLTYFADVDSIEVGQEFPVSLEDDDKVEKSFSYFIARNVARALAKIAEA